MNTKIRNCVNRSSQLGISGVITFMRNLLFPSFLLLPSVAALALLLTIFLTGCDSSGTTVESQEVSSVAWLPDESGMLAFIDKLYLNADGSQSEGQNLYRANTSGSLGNAIFPSDATPDLNYWNAPIVFVSSDGQTAITQNGTDINSIGLSNGNITDIIQGTALFGVSTDMKYVTTVATSPPPVAAILATYILTTNPITFYPHETVPGLLSNRALWLNNDQYALTIDDSTDAEGLHSHVAIYNTGGGLPTMTIPNADVAFSAGAYVPATNDLFVRTNAMGIDRINLNNPPVRTPIITTDSVESMDASNDGTFIVYTSSDSATLYTLYAVNVANLDRKQIATDIIAPYISPKRDRVACTHYIDGNNSDIQVFSVGDPP
jgi:dipeptidyl aminopeptidase/acylaminoacyl peptidase